MTILWEQRDKLQALTVIVLAIVALRRGAGPERATASVLLGMVVSLWVYKLLATPDNPVVVVRLFASVDTYFLAIDGLALVALIVIALKANRFYPILLAGCQLVSLMTHFASGLLRTGYPLAYALFNLLPFYCMIAIFTGGLLAHLRRFRRLGPYPSWRGSFGLSLALTAKPPRRPKR